MTIDMDIQLLQSELEQNHPREILKKIHSRFDNLAISFSGAEDVVLIDMACKLKLKPFVFTLDTGRLHPETYQFIETVMKHYKIDIDIVFPDTNQVQKLVSNKGLFSFYQDGHQECCGIRKVEPLARHLSGFTGWVTGQRRDQNKSTRGNLQIVEKDNTFTGAHGELIKFNPLCHWTSDMVWTYITALDVPFNTLHNKGYTSIGCEPCTRPILPHQDPREGRWWWEGTDNKECGLHPPSTSN
ncbi:MAG: phosphoadenylyl-sulfate reductase [Cycloclasticus sp.]|nr:MAG: phosphoadenylyl-sulfate reductase [Cycloclasticus sp.]